MQESPPVQTRQIPVRPENWSLTLDDLFAEMMAGKRKAVGSPESEWAREYELSLLPANVRFPHQGDVYSPQGAITLTAFFPGDSPASGMEIEVTLLSEDRLRVSDPMRERELGAHLRPFDYPSLRQRFSAPQGDEYFFYVKTALLNEAFVLIENGQLSTPGQATKIPNAPS